MKHNKLQNYQLLNNSTQSNSPPTHYKTIQKFLFFIGRLALALVGIFIFCVGIDDYIHTGAVGSLGIAPMGIVLIGLSIWKALGKTTFSILRVIILVLSGCYGIIAILCIFDHIQLGDLPTAFGCFIIAISMFGACYFSYNNAPTNTATPTVKDRLFESLPEAITKRIKKTTPDLFCTQIIAINVKKKIPHSAVALLSTGQEITVELEQTDDGFDISIPSFTPQPKLKPKF